MRRPLISLGAFLLATLPCQAYSALTHEAVVDSVWESDLRPLLLARFPKTTDDEMKDAHASAYGGCLSQDMGYSPFSARMWSDLTHYVRSGDMVEALLKDSQTVSEYAFALGALAHYTSDGIGHPTINRLTAMTYPKMRVKFGNVVTYEDSPGSHLKTEFSLDVVQVSREHYAPNAYHDFIGFKIQKHLLEQAFQETYGLQMKDIFGTEDLGIATFRYAISSLIPEMTKIAWKTKQKDIEKLNPGVTRSHYVYVLSRENFEKEWSDQYHRPGFLSRVLSFTFRIIPKIGPFQLLKFHAVPAAGEKMFAESFDATATQYRAYLRMVRAGTLHLSNPNLDTGEPGYVDDYALADKTYVKLLDKLASRNFNNVQPDLRANLLDHFKQTNQTALSEKTLAQVSQLTQVTAQVQ